MARSLIKDGLYFSVGLAAASKETVEKIVNRIVREGLLSVNEGRKLAKDVLKASNKAQKQLTGVVGKQIQNAAQQTPFATKADLEKLRKQLMGKK